MLQLTTTYRIEFGIVCTLCLLFLLSSCNRNFYYAPNPANTLGLSEAGDVKISGGTAKQNERRVFNLQGGISPLKHLGIYGNYQKIQSNVQVNEYSLFGTTHTEVTDNYGEQWDVGIGGYKELYTKKISKEADTPYLNSSGLFLDGYLSYGQGNISNLYYNGSTSKMSFKRYQLQLGTQLKLNIASIKYSLLLGSLDYEKALLTGEIGTSDMNNINLLIERDPYFYRGYNLNLELGFRMLRYYFSITHHNLPDINEQVPIHSSMFQAGLIFELDEFYKLFRNKSSNTSKTTEAEKF